MKIQPLFDRILVRRKNEETKTPGGIIIPESAKEKPLEGKVLSTGEGKESLDGTIRPLRVKAGDRILFGKYAGTELKFEGDDVLMVREEDILGLILPE